jgi:hypothetical protein
MKKVISSVLLTLMLAGCGAKSAHVFREISGKIKNDENIKPNQKVEVFLLVNGSNAPKYKFGYVDVVDNPEVLAKVVNVGNAKADFISHADLDKQFEIIDDKNCLTRLELQASCEFTIRFSGPDVGDYLKALNFSYESANKQSKTVTNTISLEGHKIKDFTPPDLRFPVLVGNVVDFGSVGVGSQRSRLVEVKNVGHAPAEISLTDFSENDFTFAGGAYPGTRGTCQTNIEHGTCFLDLNYAPLVEGDLSGELLIEYNGKMAEIILKGKGIAPGTCQSRSYEVLLNPSTTGDETAVYPYLFKAPGTVKKLQKLYWMETNHTYQAGVYTGVLDGQIQTSYLIPQEIKGKKITGGHVRFGMNKMVEKTAHYSTEMFCLSMSNLKSCSGNMFIYEDWLKLVNKDFWKGKKPVNNKFTSMLLDPANVVKLSSTLSIYSLQRLVDLRTLFSTQVDSITANTNDKYLNLIYVDDIHLDENNYLLLTVEEGCSP